MRRSWGEAPGQGVSRAARNCRVGQPYVEEVQLVGFAANAVGEQEEIALQPGHLLRGILETDTGARHDGEWLTTLEGGCSEKES